MSKNKAPEEMSSFFNLRAEGYEEHMQCSVTDFVQYYRTVSTAIQDTKEPVRILDLGCGTGLELEGVFKIAPNALITCIDMSPGMLAELMDKYSRYKEQITVIEGSYLTTPFPREFDYAVSVMTMHHLEVVPKTELYQKIKGALKPGGRYIEGDYVVTPEKEQYLLEEYRRAIAELPEGELYHIDIPFSLATQRRLFQNAGFRKFNLLWQQDEQMIYVAE